jgi:hypothetical protein
VDHVEEVRQFGILEGGDAVYLAVGEDGCGHAVTP